MRQKIWPSPLGRRVLFLTTISLLVLSSILSLRRAEALSIYFAGRGYAFRSNEDQSYRKIARTLFERALVHDARILPVDVYFRLATFGFTAGQSYQKLLEAGLAQHPNDPQLSMLLGVSAFLQDDPETRQAGGQRILSALETAEDRAALRLDTALAFQNLAGYYHLERKYAQALDLYARALHFRPEYPMALFNLGKALYALDHADEALEMFRKAIRIDPEYTSTVHQLANSLYNQGQLDAAIRLYRALLDLDPSSSVNHYNLGAALHTQGNLDEAIEAYQKALQIDPNDADVYFGLGLALETTGETDEAIGAYRRVLALNPKRAEARVRLEALLGISR